MEKEQVDAIREQNKQSMQRAFRDLEAQVVQMDPEEKNTHLVTTLQVTDRNASTHAAELGVRIDTSSAAKIILVLELRDAESGDLIINCPAVYAKPPNESYVERVPMISSIKVVDPNFESTGLASPIMDHFVQLQGKIFANVADRYGIDRYFVTVIDASNPTDKRLPGWTSKRLLELGYYYTDHLTLQKCFYIQRE